MGATSIHVQAVKPGSEIHNFREKELDYVRPELSHLNESWVGDSISHRLESAKQRYLDTVGQKMQAKAAPIREGVIVIKQETTMQELQQFATVCKERFGIEAFQIHIHKDEGYMNAKQWTPNLHAHVVFDWTQPNGKSVRLSRDDMAELQTIASETLGMERGVSSDRKHLSAMQYKTECAKEQLQELSNDISSALDKHKDVQNQLLQLQKELRSIETKKNVQKLISKASEKFYGLIGKTVNDREKDALKAKVKALEGENEQLSDRLGKAILEKEQNGTKAFKAENDKEKLWKRGKTYSSKSPEAEVSVWVCNPPPPPKGERPNGSLSQWSVTSFGFGRNFAGFGKRLCAYSKKSLWCGARRDGWSRPLPLGAPRPMIFK